MKTRSSPSSSTSIKRESSSLLTTPIKKRVKVELNSDQKPLIKNEIEEIEEKKPKSATPRKTKFIKALAKPYPTPKRSLFSFQISIEKS